MSRTDSGLIGALIGAIATYISARSIQSRDKDHRAREAARAVFFELSVNRGLLDASRNVGRLIPYPIERRTYDAVLPVLAGWLSADDMDTVVQAYITSMAQSQMLKLEL